MPTILELRKAYHAAVCKNAIYLKRGLLPSMADVSNILSRAISINLMKYLPYDVSETKIEGQSAGKALEYTTRQFLEDAFHCLEHLRPGRWRFSLHDDISTFDQYEHLRELDLLLNTNKKLRAALGDYAITPDIVVSRYPVSDNEINATTQFG